MAKSTIYATLSWAETLYQILHGYHVDGGPGQPGPIVTRDFAQIMASGIVREMSTHIHDARLARSVRQLGHDLAQRGAAEVVGNFENDGPPWTDLPFPFPWPPKKFDPQVSVFDAVQPGALDQVLSGLAHQLAEAATGQGVRTKAAAA